MKKIIARILTFVVRWAVKISPPVVANAIKEDFLLKIDKYTNGFNSITFRPKNAEQVDSYNHNSLSEKVAFVIQGPIVENESFTLETVKLYKKKYPGHLIIVSTWEGISEKVYQQLEAEAIVLLNQKPSKVGALNVNLQIESTKKGILKAKELGCDFVYKTRTDQRFYSVEMTPYFLDLLRKESLKSLGLNHKLISASMTTLKYRPYGIGDMFMFGQIDDMLLYWDSVFDERTLTKDDIPVLSISETAKLKLAETYLCTNFLDKINYSYDFTLADSWRVYQTYFLIIDHEVLNLFWYKYDWRNETRFEYFKSHTFELFKSKDRMLFSYELADEDVMSKIEGGRI